MILSKQANSANKHAKRETNKQEAGNPGLAGPRKNEVAVPIAMIFRKQTTASNKQTNANKKWSMSDYDFYKTCKCLQL